MDCKGCAIGQMEHRVTVESPTYTQDSHNEQIQTWGLYTKSWSYCRAMTAREVIQSEQVQGAIGWVIRLPYNSKTIAITSDMRMKLNSFGDRTVYCDGPAMPVDGGKEFVEVRAIEQTT